MATRAWEAGEFSLVELLFLLVARKAPEVQHFNLVVCYAFIYPALQKRGFRPRIIEMRLPDSTYFLVVEDSQSRIPHNMSKSLNMSSSRPYAVVAQDNHSLIMSASEDCDAAYKTSWDLGVETECFVKLSSKPI